MRAVAYRAIHLSVVVEGVKLLKVAPVRFKLLTPNFVKGNAPIFKTIMRPFSSSEQLKEHECWKCGTVNDKDRLFCHRIDCNAILPVTEKDVNFFETLGFHMDFNIDQKKLDIAFKELQKKLHPDKFGRSEKREQDLSTQSSSVVNSAYKVSISCNYGVS